jgi:hypothetical protein
MDDIDNALKWILKLRKEYSANSDIWNLLRDSQNIKDLLFTQLNDGSYEFSPLDRYEFDDAIISLWSSRDMVALKLITNVLGVAMHDHIPMSCYHIKDHGGLKKAVEHTYTALSEYKYVMRSDIKSYYDSINFNSLMEIIESYIKHPILLKLIIKACHRTETRGGNFYDYHEKGIPMGSPLSPLLGAIALIPLDKTLANINSVFYARFMDDWVVLTKSKTSLRKIIKITHDVLNGLKLQLHPMKTYIGKISHGFNFLAYYMDHKKLLPSKESIRRFHERITALYEQPQVNRNVSRRYKKKDRDISLYQADEEAPTDVDFKLNRLQSLASMHSDRLAIMRRYVGQWARWLKLGLSSIEKFETYVQTFLPSLLSCWTPGLPLWQIVLSV